MAQLKDSIVSGSLRITDTTFADTLQVDTIKARSNSTATTYGVGTSGQVLKSNGTNVYWANDSDSVTGVKGNAESSYRTGQVNLTPANIGAVNKTGDTMTGVLTVKGNMCTDARDGALNMNNSDIYAANSIYTADASDSAAEGIHFYRDSTHVDSLWINGGDLLFTPNRLLGSTDTAVVGKAAAQKVGRFTANPTTGQVVITDGTTGGIKSSGYTIAKSVPSDAVFTDHNTTYSMTRDGENVKLTPSSGSAQSISLSSLINGLGEGTSPSTANDYIVTQYAGGGTSNTTYYRRKASNVVNSTLVKAALGTGSDTTKYLNNKGEWAIPPNTTYSFAEGTANGKFQVTPSGGTAQSVAVHGLNNLAYKSSASATYTPAGNCTGGNVTLNTTTVPNVTGVGSLPTCTFPELSLSVNSNKRLIISHTGGSFNQGSLPTLGTAITVATSVKSVTQPTFGGTQATITVS